MGWAVRRSGGVFSKRCEDATHARMHTRTRARAHTHTHSHARTRACTFKYAAPPPPAVRCIVCVCSPARAFVYVHGGCVNTSARNEMKANYCILYCVISHYISSYHIISYSPCEATPKVCGCVRTRVSARARACARARVRAAFALVLSRFMAVFYDPDSDNLLVTSCGHACE